MCCVSVDHYLLLSLGLQLIVFRVFMVAPCISNIKYLIAQLMHSIT